VTLGSRSLFEDLFGRFSDESQERWPAGGNSPPTDIFTSEDRVVVRMDLAGVKPDDVEVTCQGNAVVVNARREFPYDAEKTRFLARGIFYGKFTNRVNVGERLDISKVSARHDNGVLELTFPYAAETQPRRIEIQTGTGSQQELSAG
jgi:HSP20 family protein